MKNINGIKELNTFELMNIQGGDGHSAWYYIFYGAAYLVHVIGEIPNGLEMGMQEPYYIP